MCITNLYDKTVQDRLDIEFIDLEHTGSGIDSENQVVVITAPEPIARSIRRAYRGRDPRRIKDFNMERTDEVQDGETLYRIYCGSSYGAGELLGSVGNIIYYASDIGAEFEGQY